jgi:CheY-like chemotaxis protein
MIESADLDFSKRAGEATPLVVCVDDETRVLTALQRVLRGEPYETIATQDPRRVLDLVKHRPVRLVVADQRMPAISGTHLLRIVRRASPTTLGLILSGHSSVPEIASALDDGTVGCFMRKPWDDAEFRTAICQMLRLKASAHRRPARPQRRKSNLRAAPPCARPLLRVECARKATAEILAGIKGFLSQSEPSLCGATVVLENLGLLEDSVSRFLGALLQALAHSPAPVALVERSGAAGDYLRLFGSDDPFLVCRSVEELPEPRRVLLVGSVGSSPLLPGQIRSAGHALWTVATVSEAIRRIILTPFDLVLLGRIFENREWIEMARRVIERTGQTPAVALPEDATPQTVLEAIRKTPRVAEPD